MPGRSADGPCPEVPRLRQWRLPSRGHLRKIHQGLTLVAVHGILRLAVEVRASLGGKGNFGKGRPFLEGALDEFGKADFRGICVAVVTPRKNLPHVSESVVALQNRSQEID